MDAWVAQNGGGGVNISGGSGGVFFADHTYGRHGGGSGRSSLLMPVIPPPQTYIVQPGQGMFAIARDVFGWKYSYDAWLKANPNLEMDENGNPLLQVGQVLKVPTETWNVTYKSHDEFMAEVRSGRDRNSAMSRATGFLGYYAGLFGLLPLSTWGTVLGGVALGAISFNTDYMSKQYTKILDNYGNENRGVLIEQYSGINGKTFTYRTTYYSATTGKMLGSIIITSQFD